MRFIRPAWLTHGGEKKDFEVYSCHVSPDGARLATAAGDGHVRVWSTDAIYNADNNDYAKPRQLASMSTHSGTVHTVRFSPDNKYLASGADDRFVCVYTLDSNPPSHSVSFGTDEAPPAEHWRVFRRLIGHENDVQDLGWSCDSSILVSVGLDSKVVVWSGSTFEKLKTLSNHQSHVKGITFDPANKYFATASDDRTIKVFRFTPPNPNSTAQDQIHNFLIETTISAPFTRSPLTTYFRRCSWAPDGLHIACPNAVNGPVSCIAVVNRGTWDCDINFIGHEGPVEVCSFSPRLYTREFEEPPDDGSKAGQTEDHALMVACAGQDKSLTVWSTGRTRPVIVAYDLTLKSISDVAWNPDGNGLFVTSLDGSITSVTFDAGDLGFVLDLASNEEALSRFGAGRKGGGLIDGATALQLEEQSKAGEITRVEGRMGELMGDGQSKSDKQTAPAALLSEVAKQGDAETTSGAEARANAQLNRDSQPEQNTEKPPQDNHAARLERLKQRVTYTKDGKKRIAPLLISGANGRSETSLPEAQLLTGLVKDKSTNQESSGQILDLSRPYDKLPEGGLEALLLGNKRGFAIPEGQDESQVEHHVARLSRDGAIPILTNGVDGLAPPSKTSAETTIMPTPEFIRPAVVNPILAVSQVRLSTPKVRGQLVHKVDNGSDVLLEVRNSGAQVPGRWQERMPARITVTRRAQILWQDYLPKTVLLVTATQQFCAAACEDGSICVWTPAGRRLLNPLIVEAQPVLFDSNGKWLLCITAVGLCYVWDIETCSSPHPPVSLAPILNIASQVLKNNDVQPSKAPSVTSGRLNSQGKMIVTLSNGDGYTYAPSMFVWQRLSEAWWAVGSQYWNATDSSLDTPLQELKNSDDNSGQKDDSAFVSAGIIPHLERRTNKEVLVRQRGSQLQRLVGSLRSREGFESFESSVSIAHLENRLAAALQLRAKHDFRANLLVYARRLGAEGFRGKAEELLRGILGNIFDDVSNGVTKQGDAAMLTTNGWKGDEETLCGWDRRELLKAVVLILGKYRELQTSVVPFADLVGITDARSDTPQDTAMDVEPKDS